MTRKRLRNISYGVGIALIQQVIVNDSERQKKPRFGTSRGSNTARCRLTRFVPWVVLCAWLDSFALGSGAARPCESVPCRHSPPQLRGSWWQAEATTAVQRRFLESLASDSTGRNETGFVRQIHLALADSRPREAYSVSVSWLTWEDSHSHVFWGREEDALEELVVGNSTSYSTHHVNLNLTRVTSGKLHSATIQGLEPSSTFFYACGDEEGGLSTVRTFDTPGPVESGQLVTLGILGDLGQTNDSRSTLESIVKHKPDIDVVLHAGDLGYADCHEARWNSFMDMLDPVASHIPWMVAAGNHEIEAGTIEGGPFAAYEHRFNMPEFAPASRGLECGVAGGLDGNETWCGPGLNDLRAIKAARGSSSEGTGDSVNADVALAAREAIVPFGGEVVTTGWPETDASGQGTKEEDASGPKCAPSEWSGTYDYGNSFYSFDVASVHVVVLNPYTATGEGSLQHAWLIEDMETCDRSLTPWVIAMFHCPWHNSNLAHPYERMALTAMRTMEPVLFKHKAALVISGHVHAYERSLPVLSGEVTEGGLVNVVVGGSGNKEDHDDDYYRVPDWSAYRNGSAFGFGTLSVMNATMASWEWKSNDLEPVVHDSTWIVNPFALE